MAFRFILSSFVAHVISLVFIGSIFLSCNKDGIIEQDMPMPEIILESESAIYTVKIGKTLTIAPKFINCDNAKILWVMNGVEVCSQEVWTHTWDYPEGSYFITVTATNAAGSVSEEIRVDVLQSTPPVIWLAVPEGGFSTLINKPLMLRPVFFHSDEPDFAVEWFLNDTPVCNEPKYTFQQTTPGVYNISIKAENVDGGAEKIFTITVYETMPIKVEFPSPSYRFDNTTRYTFPNRPVILHAVVKNGYFGGYDYHWQIDAEDVECDNSDLVFTPVAPGEYTVTVTVTRNESHTTESVKVVCVDATEQSRMRLPSAASSPYSNCTYDYTPAPGQFIGEILAGDKSAALISTPEEACAWAQKHLDEHKY
ncbi:MAG: hypothetical protein K2J74_06445, partial [Muribaculaceae bacterium]|nr:hypothetical protein [Muribaculaceae bacterium]